MSAEPDRVRAHSPQNANDRIHDLGREWDMERVLQANASVAALAGIGLGLAVNRRWLALPGVVFSFFLQHALQGWCPPVSAFRRLGVRTRREINAEKYALKALRGDFDQVVPAAAPPVDRSL